MKFKTFQQFLFRPYAGIELEIFIATVECCWGIAFLFISVQPLQVIYHVIPHQLLSVPWLAAGLCNIIGIFLYFYNIKNNHLVRWYGTLISFIIWTWMSVFTLLSTGIIDIIFIFYVCSAIASFRLMLTRYQTI